MSSGTASRFVVYDGVKRRSPRQAARVTAEDGRVFHVLDTDLTKVDDSLPRLPFPDAVAEACHRAGRPVGEDA